MRALLLLVLLAGCAGPKPFRADTVALGLEVDFAGAVYPDLEPYLASCAVALEVADFRGGRAKFYPTHESTAFNCDLKGKVAGCWLPELDTALVTDAPDLGRTALCHELAHRALYRRTGDPDHAHRSPLFSRADRVGRVGTASAALAETPPDGTKGQHRCGAPPTRPP